MGVRIVWTMHNLGGHDGLRHEAEMTVHRDLVGLADAVLCHCVAAREAAIRAYGLEAADAARLHVVPHGSYVGALGGAIIEHHMARSVTGAMQNLEHVFAERYRLAFFEKAIRHAISYIIVDAKSLRVIFKIFE